MQGQATSQNGALGRPQAFRYFLWRRHRQRDSLHGFVPEVLATDGQTVRRMVAEKGQLVVQQFADPTTGEAIISAVEERSSEGIGILGYSMFADAHALAILHTGDSSEAGWLAFPYDGECGRPAGIPTMPLTLDEVPVTRLVGGTQLCWRDCNLALDVAVEQRGDHCEASEHERISLLDHLVGWRLVATVLRQNKTQTVRLARGEGPIDGICRSSTLRAEASFGIDAQLFNNLSERSDFKAWFMLEFDRALLCLPPDWCRWWFEVDISRQPLG